MGERADDPHPDAGRPAVPQELQDRVRQFGERLAAQDARAGPRVVVPDGTVSFASRAGSDLVAAVLVGIAFGAAVDAAFDSWPVAIVTLTLLGGVAAVRTSYRTARAMADETPGGPEARPKTD